MTSRYAIYFTPEPDSAFEQAGATCLGRNARTGWSGAPLHVPGIPPARMQVITAAPRRYGFHGTLKAPFHLAETYIDASLMEAVAHLATQLAPFDMPPLTVAELGSFIALKPQADSDALRNLADTCVTTFDPLRAPMTPEDRARRQPDKLTAGQRENLDRWGYPYVFDEFRFHMTLTGPVQPEESKPLMDAYREVFDSVLAEPVSIDCITVFEQKQPDQPFSVRQSFRFSG
ncbi:MAG: DUF1045 domain-containing protein [Alphaproteobacteria bacterium]